MSLNILISDVFDFSVLPHPRNMVLAAPASKAGASVTYHHQQAGTIALHNLVLPHLQAIQLNWTSGEQDIVMQDNSEPSDTINISFQLGGHMYTTFKGLSHALDMKPGRHNLVYAPEQGDVNHIKANQTLQGLHISLDKHFFAASIGCDDAWSESIQNKIAQKRAFSGVEGTLEITPQMQHLINSLRWSAEAGALSTLLIQSRLLELISLQLEQFKQEPDTPQPMRADDADKLHQLKHYLDVHYLEELSLTQLSRQCLLNEFKLKKGFRQLFGTTVFGYIKKLRMEHASLLLRSSALSVEEVAFQLGYEHAHHFAVAYKKYYGVNPSHHLRHKRISQVCTDA